MSLKKLKPSYWWRVLREKLPERLSASERNKAGQGYSVPVSGGRAAYLGDVLRLDDSSPITGSGGWPELFEQLHRSLLDIPSYVGQAWPMMRSAMGPAAEQRDALALAAYPGVALAEDGSHYLASVEVPGLELDELGVRVQGNLLVIKGHAAQSTERYDDNFYQYMRSVEAFSHSFKLPPDADGARLDPSVNDNVLTVAIARR